MNIHKSLLLLHIYHSEIKYYDSLNSKFDESYITTPVISGPMFGSVAKRRIGNGSDQLEPLVMNTEYCLFGQ